MIWFLKSRIRQWVETDVVHHGRGMVVHCSCDHICMIFDKGTSFPYQNMSTSTTPLDELKGWIDPLISNATPRWIEAWVSIVKKDLDVVVQYWFRFIRNSIMPPPNYSILNHRNVACLEYIIPIEASTWDLLLSRRCRWGPNNTKSKGRITELISEPDLVHRMDRHSTFLVTKNTFLTNKFNRSFHNRHVLTSFNYNFEYWELKVSLAL